MSGKVVLMNASKPSSNPMNRNDTVRHKYIYDKVKTCKPNVLKTYNHHDSKGACSSFGNNFLWTDQ